MLALILHIRIEFVGINESVATTSVAFAATTDTAAFATETIDDNKNSNQNIPDNIASEDDATNSDGDIKSDPYSILTKILSYSNQNTFSGCKMLGFRSLNLSPKHKCCCEVESVVNH